MAVYEKGLETKRRLVLITYEKLKKKDASSITVREITECAKCSPAALYRHYDSLEYLIALASIRFLDKYMAEYGRIMDSEENLLVQYVKGWDLFNRYAFERPDIYYRLMWGQYNKSFGDAMDEYYELFHMSGSEKYPAQFYTLMFTDNIEERDLQMLKRAVNHNLLSEEDAVYYSKSNTLMVSAMLQQCMGQDLIFRERRELECGALIRRNMEKVFAGKPWETAIRR